ncbi:MAG TPA: 1-phosphofructokinase family hexose kinase [Chitinophagaceae bacterium]|nr:1-phosphofructokinase family hexose kinase [Chitinophagaceae bacterium]
MSAIVTITFSPCIDKSTSVRELLPEKKLRCAVPMLDPGGGGVNVARAIHKLGGEALAVFPSGGYTGKQFNALLSAENIPSCIIETKNETRENIIVVDESTSKQYRFGMPGTELTPAEWQQCLDEVNKMEGLEFIVASGSLPPGVPMDIYARLAVIAKKKNAKLVIDTSGEALRHASDEGVYLLKPNLGELASLIGRERLEESELEEIGKQFVLNGHCEVLVVSLGGAGAVLITANEMHHVVPPKVDAKSVVGAGDSMVAGMVLSLSRHLPMNEVLQIGVACGTAATLNPGTDLCRKEDVEMLLKMIREAAAIA